MKQFFNFIGSGQGHSYGRVQTFHGRPVGTHRLLNLVSKMEQFFEQPRTIPSTIRKEIIPKSCNRYSLPDM